MYLLVLALFSIINLMKDGKLTPNEIAACAEFSRLLKASGLSQAEVAHNIGLSQNMVSKMASAHRAITIDTAIAIADYFNIPVYQLDPDLQMRINSAYNSPHGGNIGGIIEALKCLDLEEVMTAMDELQSLIRAKIQDVKVNN